MRLAVILFARLVDWFDNRDQRRLARARAADLPTPFPKSSAPSDHF